jgi:hypothetical protein
MTPHDAAKILELDPAAPPDQIEARFLELRTKLEEKIGKAPTPGLKEKYRDSLAEITTAFETLTLAADSSTLPVLKKQRTEVGERSTEIGGRRTEEGKSLSPLPPTENQKSKIENRKSGTEFLWVAIIAAVVLGAGGWWVLKTRAENEEKARLAAEAKAEAERQAQLAREQAERDRLAKEAAAKAEQERLEKLFTSLRGKVAELNVAYDALMRAEQAAERELNELKSQARELAREQKAGPTPELRRANALLAAQEKFTAWLRDTLPSHPAKVAKARAEELLSARAADEAAGAVEAYAAALTQLKADLASARATTVVTGTVSIDANVPGAVWRMLDGFGVMHEGTTPGRLTNVGPGKLAVEIRYKTFSPERREATLEARGEAAFRAEFEEAVIRFRVTPATATVAPAGQAQDGWQVFRVGPGRHLFRFTAPGHAAAHRVVAVGNGEKRDIEVTLDAKPASLLLAETSNLLSQALRTRASFDSYGHTADPISLWLSTMGVVFGREEYTAALEQVIVRNPGQNTYFARPTPASSKHRSHQLANYGPAITLAPIPDWFESLWSEAIQLQAQAAQGEAAPAETPPPKAPLAQALELIAAGKDPLASGLRRQDLVAKAKDVADHLIRVGRTDLAYDWMQQAVPEGGHLTARLRTRDWMGALAAAGRVDEAIAIFESDQARWKAADPEITYFNSEIPNYGAMTEIFRMVRHRADLAGLDKLASLVRREKNTSSPPPKDPPDLELWRQSWLEPLQLSGLTPEENTLVERVIFIAESTASSQWGKPKPAQIPPGTPASVAQAAKLFTHEYGSGLTYQGGLFRYLLAKKSVAVGKSEDAYALVAKSQASMPWRMVALAYSQASLGRWDDAVDALERSDRKPYNDSSLAGNADAQRSQRVHRVYLAEVFGIALAERWEEQPAHTALRGLSDPLERVHAVCSYLLRRHELESMTAEQRAYLRTAPPI